MDHDSIQQERNNLYWALRSRVLTDEEMERVAQLGVFLVVQPMIPFDETQKQKELNDALLQQFRMRTMERVIREEVKKELERQRGA